MIFTNIADIEGIIAVCYTSISQTIHHLQNYMSWLWWTYHLEDHLVMMTELNLADPKGHLLSLNGCNVGVSQVKWKVEGKRYKRDEW